MSVYRCADCNNPMTRDEVQVGRCPACGFRIAAADRDESEDRFTSRDVYDYPSASRGVDFSSGPLYRSSSRNPWNVVAGGLLGMLISDLIMGAVLVVYVVLLLALGAQPLRNAEAVGGIVAVVFVIFMIVGAIAYVVGMVMCVWSPAGRGWMIAALALLGGVVVVIMAIACIGYFSQKAALEQRGGNFVQNMVVLAAATFVFYGLCLGVLVCEAMFFRAVGVRLGRRGLVISSLSYLGFSLLGTVLYCVTSASTTMIQHAGADRFTKILGIVFAVGSLGLYVWKAILLGHTRAAVVSA